MLHLNSNGKAGRFCFCEPCRQVLFLRGQNLLMRARQLKKGAGEEAGDKECGGGNPSKTGEGGGGAVRKQDGGADAEHPEECEPGDC